MVNLGDIKTGSVLAGSLGTGFMDFTNSIIRTVYKNRVAIEKSRENERIVKEVRVDVIQIQENHFHVIVLRCCSPIYLSPRLFIDRFHGNDVAITSGIKNNILEGSQSLECLSKL